MDDTDKQRYIELTELVRAAKEVIAEATAEMAPLEAQLLDHMANVGMDKFRMNGYSVYIQDLLWAWPRGGDHPAALRVFKRLAETDERYAGLVDLAKVTVNKNTLSKVFREWKEGGVEIPSELAEVIDLTTTFKLIVRKGSVK